MDQRVAIHADPELAGRDRHEIDNRGVHILRKYFADNGWTNVRYNHKRQGGDDGDFTVVDFWATRGAQKYYVQLKSSNEGGNHMNENDKNKMRRLCAKTKGDRKRMGLEADVLLRDSSVDFVPVV